MSSSLNSGSRPWYLPHGVDGVAPFGDPATPVPEQKSPFQPPKTWTLKHGGPILLGEPERKPTMSVSVGPCTFLQVRCYSWAEMDGTRPTPAWPSPLLCHQPAPLRRTKKKANIGKSTTQEKKIANTTKMDTRKGHNTTKKKKCPKTANKDYPKKMHRSTKEATPRFFPPPPPPGPKTASRVFAPRRCAAAPPRARSAAGSSPERNGLEPHPATLGLPVNKKKLR